MVDTAAPPVVVAALYRFTSFSDPAALRPRLQEICDTAEVRGTLLVANEGINGTIAGSPAAMTSVLSHIRSLPGCSDLDVKLSRSESMPFHRMKVRLKREIVTLGLPDIDPVAGAGSYVEPGDWNKVIRDPRTILIDTRNGYETAIGTFESAIAPETVSFRDFPNWFRANRAMLLGDGAEPRIAMFCTGGIRCEKATAFLKGEGVANVVHLKGGILNYLEIVPVEDSLWRGECFVFDQRVAVGHGLGEGTHTLCHACREPLGPEDRVSPFFEEGASCPACHGERTEEQRASYRERHRQERLAAARGVTHVGAVYPTAVGANGG